MEQNNKDIQKLFGQIMASAVSGGIGSKGLDRAVSLFNKEVNFRNEVETLENSDITYHVSSNAPGSDMRGRPLAGKTDYNESTKQIDVTIGGNGIDILAHELTHAYQFEIGEVAFGAGKVLTDVTDERQAEENGYLFRGSGYQDFIVAGNVTNDYMVNKRGYSDIPGSSLTLSSTGADLYKATGDTYYRYYPDISAKNIFEKRNQLLINSGKTIMFIYNDVLRVKNKE